MLIRGKTFEPADTSFRIQKIRKIRRSLIKWGRKNFENFPWRSTDNHFHALLAEVMLQRTRAEQVVPVFIKFTSRYNTPEDAAAENHEKILELLKPLGLEWRSKKILELINELNKRNRDIPCNINDLLTLPGVGLYVASSFISFQADIRSPIIDNNAVRIWGRIFDFKTDSESRRKKWFIEIAYRITPQKKFKEFNYAVLDFTRKICKPKPLCNICILKSICAYNKSLKNN